MRLDKEEPSSICEQVIDLISAVKELHAIGSQDLSKLLRDSENFTISIHTEEGSTIKIDVEKLASLLPLHLIAVLISSDREESLFKYLLRGIRLLHSLCDLAPRHAKIEQILFDDVKTSEQLLDLVFYLLVVLSGYREENGKSISTTLLYSALVACSLYLLTGCISSHWQDLVQVLVAHPKVDTFMDAAFGAVHVAIRFLQTNLSAEHADFLMRSTPTAQKIVNYLCQQCEASVQFLQSLCQQKLFRERLLKNEELCKKGGVLSLAQAILKLNIAPPFSEAARVVAAVSRLKAKVLSILLNLCEAESISYLDEVAGNWRSFALAKSVALEVLELLKSAVYQDTKRFTVNSDQNVPMGLLRLNAMRLADVMSDDSNFRSYITTSFTRVLTAVFLLPHGDFLSIWCSSELPSREEDATLDYDTFAAAGWVLDTLMLENAIDPEIHIIPSKMSQATYAHQRTSLFVKVIANLHCFVSNVCKEQERNHFLNKFLDCMRMDPSKSLPGFSFASGVLKAVSVGKNLRSLLSHAASLIPNFLNEEDVQLLRVFFNQLQNAISSSDFEETEVQGTVMEVSKSLDMFSKPFVNDHHLVNTGGNPKEEMSENSSSREEELHGFRNEDMNCRVNAMEEDKKKTVGNVPGASRENDGEVQNVETSGSDTSSTREKNLLGQMASGHVPKSSEHDKESGPKRGQEDEKQPRKRKRNIMNDYQVTLIEKALVDEPEMQRNAAAIQSWADQLSKHGSEVTSSQLKNWINNRKARLARIGTRSPMEVESARTERQVGSAPQQSPDSTDSPAEENSPSSTRGRQSTQRVVTSAEKPEAAAAASVAESSGVGDAESTPRRPGQQVVLVDDVGSEIGKGKIYQVQGKWHGKSLEESNTCVVDVTELKAEKWTRLLYPSEPTGVSFIEAERKMGVMRVLWDSGKLVFR